MPRFKPQRTIPPNSQTVIRQGVDAVVYTTETAGVPYAIGYSGKRNRPDFHFRFRNEAQRAEHIQKFFDDKARIQDWRATQQAEATAKRKAGHGIQLGQVLYSSWGWEQTNIDYYEVVKVTPGSITVRQLQQDTQEVGFMSGPTVPRLGQYRKGEPDIRSMFNGRGFRVKHGSLSPWDGKPKTCSWYA
jgi:hypothetical protein